MCVGRLGGGGEQVSGAWGPLADQFYVFLQLVSQKAGLGPGGGGFVARAAK